MRPRPPAGSVPRTPFRSVREVADILNCCERTVFRRIREGQLRAHRNGRLVRVSDEDLAAYLAQTRG